MTSSSYLVNVPALAAFLVAACLGSTSSALGRPASDAVFPARAGNSQLIIECNRDNAEKAVWLRVTNPQRGWRADLASEVKIGDQSFKVEIDGASDSFILSDVPLPDMGLTDSLLSAAKAGEELVLSGPAAEQIPGPRRSFPLKGARAKIERAERACGRPPAP